MKNKRILSIISIILGTLLIVNSQTSILNVNLSPGSSIDISLILGLVFIVIGIFLGFATVRQEQEEDIDDAKEKEKNRKKFINYSVKPFREYLEQGDFNNVDKKTREQYWEYKEKLHKQPFHKKDQYIRKIFENFTKKSKLEKTPEIYISKKAIRRSEGDNTISNDFKKYMDEIDKIAKNPLERPQEIIGDFRISPRGNNSLRVAWHYDKEKNKLYIDDFLYHINEADYVDRWNDKASNGDITIEDYEKSGYDSHNT